MAFAPGPKDAQVSISVFGGLVTEMSAWDVPEGVSPDCQDVTFAPGNLTSRGGLNKVLSPALPSGGPNNKVPTVTYAKSFVHPSGTIYNLYLDSNFSLWEEDVLNTPGTVTLLATVSQPSTGFALLAKSITAFNREYIAISDGLLGQEVPLQWDGTNLDRVTQEGPGAPPTVASVSLPSVAMVATGAPPVLTLTESDPAGQSGPGGYFTRINTWTSSSIANAQVGDSLTIAGYAGSSAPMNGTWTILQIFPGVSTNLLVLQAFLPSTTVFSTAAATGTLGSGTTITRNNNVVTVTTASAHGLQVGYQAQVTGVPAAAIGGGAASIVISNENLPGIATITTNSAHGLIPGVFVAISGVASVAVGGGISTASRTGGIVNVTTNSPHGLTPGSVVTISGANSGLNTTASVASVASPTSFTIIEPASSSDIAGAAGGAVNLNWPIPDTPDPTYFEVLAAPTSTTFQVSVNYSDGTWGSATVNYAWNGTFFVSAVPNTTTFQYQQYGPNATSSAVGTVTPYGQAAPGQKQCQVLFLTRQGYITKPSPPTKLISNGGQYISVSNIPIGPSNVIARILAFTGADGATFFYIPTPAQINGQQVSTATQINDNTTTSVVLDFSDNTLFAATSISVPGNTPADQIVLDGALGFGFYGGRIITWGQRNRIQNMLGMSFDSGTIPFQLFANIPLGWTPVSNDCGITGGSKVDTGHFGSCWNINIQDSAQDYGKLSQSMYQDAYGAPIATANTLYRFRVWLKPSVVSNHFSITATISSASASFTTTAVISGSAMNTSGGFLEQVFSASTPTPIPSDLTFTIKGSATIGGPYTVLVDEMSLIYEDNKYLSTVLYGSYVNNPEAFDGVTGKFGSIQDPHKVMDIADVRQTLYILTQDPGGRIHQTRDNGITEPAGWTVDEVAANCGLVSAFGLTKSQADDSSAAGGEEWFAWISRTGARIFGGDQPWKISQEIQPDWDSINPEWQSLCWCMNDPNDRILYFGLPGLGSTQTGIQKVYTMSYRELDTAYQIATSGPIRTSFTGRLIATDHTRKWTRWNLTMNYGALMYRQAGKLSVVFCGGNGNYPAPSTVGFGNVYTLNPQKLTDDDYGQIAPYYVTYFLVGHDQEQALQLGGARKLLAYLAVFASGVGQLSITVLCDTLTNPWPVSCTRNLSSSPKFDTEWAGGEAQAQRMALKFASLPLSGTTDNSLAIQKVTAWLRKVVHLPVRGSSI